MSRKSVLFYCLCGAATLAILHPSPYAPVICYGMAFGSALALFSHWLGAEMK